MNANDAVAYRDFLVQSLFDSALKKVAAGGVTVTKDIAEDTLESVFKKVGPGITSDLIKMALTTEEYEDLQKRFADRKPSLTPS